MAPTHLLCEYKKDPIGMDDVRPGLSWEMPTASAASAVPPAASATSSAAPRNESQSAYRVLVADDPDLLRQNIGNLWDSKKVSSSNSLQIPYAGMTLSPTKICYWKVMIWDNKGVASPWSEPARWQMGLLTAADWRGARWISYAALPDSLRAVPAMPGEWNEKWDGVKDVLPLLRKSFTIHKKITRATIYISGLGQFDLHVNGKKVGDHFLDPGWTKYDKHALYVTFDLTRQLQPGKNSLGVMLGNGFYFIPGERYRKLSGAFGNPTLICRLLIQYQDGSSEDIVSDSSWKTAAGPVTFSSIYGGEDYDARLEQRGWDQAAFDDRGWRPAAIVTGPPELDAQMAEPLKIFEHFHPKKITQPRPGVWVYDLGQNASGIPCLSVKGKRGSVIKITPSELLSDSGLAYQEPIGAPVSFSYTLKGQGIETWQPQFMYYGFRYLQVEGGTPAPGGAAAAPAPGAPLILDLQALHTRNAAPRVGSFSCSSELFNKTFTLIDWAIQSNTASIFTDCPHREKLGWLEEAHLVGSSIHYNYDIASLGRKVIRDIIQSQTPEGLIPDIAPEYVQFDGGFRDSPEWGSTGILLPWYLYEWYGDRKILEEGYDMMTRYAAYLDKKGALTNHILSYGLGDWFDIGPNSPGESQLTPKGVTSTAIFYYDLTILSGIAELLGKPNDAKKYTELAAQVKQAFNDTFFNKATAQYATGSQTANAVAVYMGLVDTAWRQAVINNIVKDIRDRHNSLTAGDIGYRYLLRVLDDAGRSDVIYDMNSRTDVPGYGFQLAHGATALTESWQAYRDVSNDHFMLGHLMEWFYSGPGGIRPAPGAVAFREIDIRPESAGHLTAASASYRSPYGVISTRWTRQGSHFSLIVTIPGNCRANIFLPASPQSVITESGHPLKGNRSFRDGRAIYKVGSGTYQFEVED